MGTARSTCRLACLLILTGVLAFVLAAPAGAVVYSFGRHTDKERLVFQLPELPGGYTLERSGVRELTLRLPEGGLGAAGALPDFGGSRLIAGLAATGDVVRVSLRTAAVGFVAFTLEGPPRLVVDVFSDPLGARWTPGGTPLAASETAAPNAPVRTARTRGPQAPEPEAAPQRGAPATPAPERTESATARAAEPRGEAKAAGATPEPQPRVAPETQPGAAPQAAPVSVPEPRSGTAGQPESASAPQAAAQPAPGRVDYELPYIFRGRVTPPGEKAPPLAERVPSPEEQMLGAQGATEPLPPATRQPEMAEGAAAPAAEPGMAEDVGSPARQGAAALPEDATPVEGKPGRFVVAPPSHAPVPPQAAAPGQGAGTQAAPAMAPAAKPKPPADSKPLRREVVERATENMLSGSAPPSQFRGRVFQPGDLPPAPTASPDAPLPQPDAEPSPEPEAQAQAEQPREGEAQPTGDAAQGDAGQMAMGEGGEGQNATAEAQAQARQDYFDDIMFAARAAQGEQDWDTALQELDLLLRQPDVPPDMAEEAMYMRADIVATQYRDDPLGHYDEISGAYEMAINHNLDSWRVPAALLKRGVLSLKVGNIPEAAAFFTTLREKYKGDPNVPLTYYYWGDHYFKHGEFQKAADEFQYLVQVYPDSKFVREASLGLARALRNLGYDKQAFQIVDYIEKRWPRFYVEFPPFLRLLGDAAYRVEDYEKAKNDYWTYYNIDPTGDEADIILARLGDIYVRTGRPEAAREMYDKAVEDFGDREGGLIAKMRLAEEGIYDEPSLEQMFTVFERPLNLAPADIYEDIVTNHADSPLAPLAQLKRAMWFLWNNKHLDSLAAVMEFEEKFPDSNLSARAKEVGVRAFSSLAEQLIRDENFPKIVNLWQDYPFLHDRVHDMLPEARIALALSFWKRGLPAQALDVVRPFLNEEQVKEHSEVAMSLALSIYAESGKWDEILGVDEAVGEWELRPDFRRELSYAKALALENLGRFDESRPLWIALGNDQRLDPEQRAYAIFFLAQESLAADKLKEAYQYAQDAYEMLVAQGGDQDKVRECLRILMEATDRSARYREALKWATELEKLISQSDPSWAALRYRMAGFYRRAGDKGKWREMLEALAKAAPTSLYGRMAASDLQLEKIEAAAREYTPSGTF